MFGLLAAVSMIAPCADTPAADPFVQDLEYANEVIQSIHPEPFAKISETDWQASLGETIQGICDANSDAERTTLLMSQISRMGDGHTLILPTDQPAFETWIPIRFYAFAEGVYVTAARTDHADLVGSRLIAIGGVPAADALSQVMRISPSENRFHQMEMAAPHLSNMGVLLGLGMIGTLDGVQLTVENPDGATSTIEISSYQSWYSANFRFWGEMFGPPVDPYEGYVTAFDDLAPLDFRNGDPARPPYLRDRSPYWADYLQDSATLYIQLNTQMESPNLPFADFREQVSQLLDQELEQLVIDLRFNFGGDGSMLLPLVHDIIRSNHVGMNRPVIVLTGRQTFSSGVMMAGLIDQHTNAVFVGETMGANLNDFGDARSYSLPNTGLSLNVSTLYWQMGRPDLSDSAAEIDFPVPLRADDYFAGRDAPVELILGSEDIRSIAQVFLNDGADAGRALFERRIEQYAGTDYWRAFPSDPDEMGRAIEQLQSRNPEEAYILVEYWARYSPRSIRAQERWAEMALEIVRCDDFGDALTSLRQMDRHHPLLLPDAAGSCAGD